MPNGCKHEAKSCLRNRNRKMKRNHVYSLRNRKHFPCFHTVIETRVEVWENEKLKWEHEPVLRRGNYLLYQSVNSPYCS